MSSFVMTVQELDEKFQVIRYPTMIRNPTSIANQC
jgi:hypothetical protein